MSFDEKLKQGQAGESLISNWLKQKGYSVLPIYEKILETGKGPQIFTANTNLVAPDLFVFGPKIRFVEAKTKTAFAWHRISQQWTTGIDRHHYRQYLEVDKLAPWPVWLLFLQMGGQAKDSPPDSPSGLFGNSLEILSKCIDHEHWNHGRYGMVYWGIKSLLKLAELEDIIS